MVNTWKPILAALVIFAAGVVTGGLTVKLRQQSTAPRPGSRVDQRPLVAQRWEGELRDLSRRIARHLDLTPTQRARIEATIQETQKRMRGVWEEIAPRTRDEFRQMRQKIREELTPEQRRRFEELFKEREGAGKRGERQPPPVNSRLEPPPGAPE